jgi:DNA-binding response OmpR family regulator
MNKAFQIALISDDPYHLGLLIGYCHVHHYEILETADIKSLNAMIQMQPNIVILVMGLAQDPAKKTDLELIHQLSITHKIPVCYLRDTNNASSLEKNMARWVDAILDTPLDLNQLDNYLYNRFKHHHCFIQEKRNRARRAANERRLLMLERQNAATFGNQSANNMAKNGDADYFIVEPFQIDQRSKRVLLNGKSLNLTRKEFDLFELLAKEVDRVFMSNEIINHVWPENNRVTKSDLYQYMHLLRKKIETDPNNPHWILTVKGFGYKLNVPESAQMNSPGVVIH